MKREIKQKLLEIDTNEANMLVDKIEQCKDNAHKMFQAVKHARANKPNKRIKITKEDGTVIIKDNEKADMVKEYFEKQMTIYQANNDKGISDPEQNH